MIPEIKTFGGILLCGGKSQRMGQSKAWLDFQNEPLLLRIARRMQRVIDPLIVVAAPGQNLPALPDHVLIVRDEEEGNGPLQGIAAGLSAMQDRAEAAFVSSCDVPFLQPALIQRMIDLMGEHAICVPKVQSRYHPLAAMYRTVVLEPVQQLLAAEKYRPFFLFEQVPTRIVDESSLIDIDPNLTSFQNVNTPEDYADAVRLAEQEAL